MPEPGNPRAYDRYAYVVNNPLKFIDPGGYTHCTPDDPACKKKGINWVKGFSTVKDVKRYAQKQTDRSGCAPTSMAIALNIVEGNPSRLNSTDFLDYLEDKYYKIPGIGIPTQPYFPTINQGDILMDLYGSTYDIELRTGATKDELKNTLSSNAVAIVSVSWETNLEIAILQAEKIFGQGNGPTVGHAMVLAGYDQDTIEYIFLDPGTGGLKYYKEPDLEQIWLNQPNIFIPPGSMVVISDQDNSP